MERRNKVQLLVFSLIAILVALFVIWKVEAISGYIGSFVLSYGYPAILIVVFIIEILEQPIGPEVPGLFAIGFGLNVYLILFITLLGSFVGSFFSLYVGRVLLSRRINKSCSTDKYRNYCLFFEKYGNLSLLVAALTPVPFVFFCWLSGAFNMSLKSFIAYGVLPRMVRLVVVLGGAGLVLSGVF